MKYIVQVKEGGQWVDQGDGPLTQIQADRIAMEIRNYCRVPTRIIPAN